MGLPEQSGNKYLIDGVRWWIQGHYFVRNCGLLGDPSLLVDLPNLKDEDMMYDIIPDISTTVIPTEHHTSHFLSLPTSSLLSWISKFKRTKSIKISGGAAEACWLSWSMRLLISESWPSQHSALRLLNTTTTFESQRAAPRSPVDQPAWLAFAIVAVMGLQGRPSPWSWIHFPQVWSDLHGALSGDTWNEDGKKLDYLRDRNKLFTFILGSKRWPEAEKKGLPTRMWIREPNWLSLQTFLVWCHWASSHHPTKCHYPLWLRASETGITGMASSLSAPFLGVSWKDLVCPDALVNPMALFLTFHYTLRINMTHECVLELSFALSFSPSMCVALNYMP